MKTNLTPITAEYRLDMIPLMLNKHKITFSQAEAVKLVGGLGKLLKLIESGKVRVEKKTPGVSNSKWLVNAGDIIRCMRL